MSNDTETGIKWLKTPGGFYRSDCGRFEIEAQFELSQYGRIAKRPSTYKVFDFNEFDARLTNMDGWEWVDTLKEAKAWAAARRLES
jgi:hypothetical protein